MGERVFLQVFTTVIKLWWERGGSGAFDPHPKWQVMTSCRLGVPWILNKSVTVSPAKHHHTTSSMLHGGNHTCWQYMFTYSASHKDSGWNQKSQIWTHQTKGQISTGLISHCLCFLAQVSLFFLLVSFSSGFFAEIRPWMPDSRTLIWTVDVHNIIYSQHNWLAQTH